MPIQALIQQIALATTWISLITTATAAMSWSLASFIRGAPIPWREFKQYGEGLAQDAIKSVLYLAVWSSIAAFVSWVVSAIAAAV